METAPYPLSDPTVLLTELVAGAIVFGPTAFLRAATMVIAEVLHDTLGVHICVLEVE